VTRLPLIVLFGLLGCQGSPEVVASAGVPSWPGLRVRGRFLEDQCGERVVLRGVDELAAYGTDPIGTEWMPEIARTGANAVRLAWLPDRPAAELDTLITNAIGSQLIPMPDCHNCQEDGASAAVAYFTRSDVLAVLVKHEQHLLINPTNGLGNPTPPITDDDWVAEFTDAIARLREAGLHVPLVIDPPSDADPMPTFLARGADLLAADPDHNLLFAIRLWWRPVDGRTVAELDGALDQAVAAGIPVVISEYGSVIGDGCQPVLPAADVLASAEAHEIGWLAWSWGAVGNSPCNALSMTSDGTFDTLEGWGLEVAVTDPGSIQNTSVRPASMTGGCR
jgi:mannan endo-1,4-beta-mannosidase